MILVQTEDLRQVEGTVWLVNMLGKKVTVIAGNCTSK